MAQILIKKAPHFAETVQPEKWSALKWGGRPRRGDIVEVRENGYWRIESLGTGTHGWNRAAFALIQVTNLTLAEIAHYQGMYADNPDTPTKTFKNRYGYSAWESIPWVKNTVTVGGKQFSEWYYIRANWSNAILKINDKAAI